MTTPRATPRARTAPVVVTNVSKNAGTSTAGAGVPPWRRLALVAGLVGLAASTGSAQGHEADSVSPGSHARVHAVADFSQEPTTGLTLASDGNFYGVTSGPPGSLYRLTPDGQLSVLYTFHTVGSVTYALAQASDGSLWGTSEAGGANQCGIIFRVTLDGVFSDMHDFDCHTGGDLPMSGLTADATGGAFFGTTYGGGDSDDGVVYRITLDGQFQVVGSFSPSTGKFPRGNLLLGRDGCLYGTTPTGGAGRFGTLYNLCQGNSGYALSVLHDFIKSEANGGVLGGLVYDAAQQWMWATATTTVFAFDPDTRAIQAAKLRTFQTSPLVLSPDGGFYATGTTTDTFQSEVVSFDAQLREHPVADLTGIPQATSPLALSPKGALWGTVVFTQGNVAGQAFKVTGY